MSLSDELKYVESSHGKVHIQDSDGRLLCGRQLRIPPTTFQTPVHMTHLRCTKCLKRAGVWEWTR